LPSELYIKSYEIYKTIKADPSPFFNHLDHNIGLAVVVALLLNQFLNKNLSVALKVLSILFMISASINMSFIGSRTGYVLYLVLIISVLLFTYRENIKKAIFIGLILVLSIIYIGYNYSTLVNSRINLTYHSYNKIIESDNYKSSIGLRLGFTKYSIEVIKKNPIFGVGTGDYMDEVHKVIPKKHEYISKMIAQPHNVYIKTLLQFGLFGLFGLLLIFYRLIVYKDCEKYNKGIIIISVVTVLIVMLTGKFYGYFILPLFVVFTSSMIVNYKQNIEYEKMNFKTILIYSILAILFFILGIVK
jgi:O-antigen ligase